MKVKIITRHTPSNYGSLLQSIATQQVLKAMGHECEIIDYQRKDERGLKMIIEQLKGKKSFSNPIKKLAYILVRYPIEKFAQVRFDAMRMRYLKMTKRCSTHEELSKIEGDVFITGSDQVWGPTINGTYDSAYFLQFVKSGIPRLAYAASFGKTKFETTTIDAYKKMLATYRKITVRENSAVELIKDWNGSNCIGQVLDPTLLLSKEKWIELFPQLQTSEPTSRGGQICTYISNT